MIIGNLEGLKMKLKSINKIKSRVSWDIEVENTNCFFANGVLVHNSNLGVGYNNKHKLWAMSRNNMIKPGKDNAGSAMFVHAKSEAFETIFQNIAEHYDIDLDNNSIYIWGEWAGKGIQSGVGISELPKSYYIFACKVNPNDPEIEEYWVDENLDFIQDNDNLIFNINQFKKYDIEIDFENPQLSQNKMIELMEEVEKECPVAKQLGIDNGVGEGIVFKFTYANSRHVFKVKGEKHAGKSKVKVLKPIDEAYHKLTNEIAEKVTPVWRLEQIYQNVFDTLNGGKGDIKKTGEFLKAMFADIIKEELDLLAENGLTLKDINGKVAKISKVWFMNKLNEEVGLK